MKHKIFCLVGPSGTGKDTIKEQIPIPHLVSYRTRAKRVGEIDGIHGHFISKVKFLTLKKEGKWAAETEYPEDSGCYYGVLWEQLEVLKEHPLLYVVDWNGVQTLRESFQTHPDFSEDQIVSIYIDSSMSDLERRMREQGRSEEEIQKRLQNVAVMDLPAKNKCDYIVKNYQWRLNDTVATIEHIILKEMFGCLKQEAAHA
jgi:guanylate kinase